MNEEIKQLIKLLNLSDDDILRALLSVYSPCQPQALKLSWDMRKNYGPSPTSEEIWSLYKKYDFKCINCNSQYRISIDHIDNNKTNSNIENLQVLCQSCNRAKQKRGTKNKDLNVKIYKSLINLYKLTNKIPTPLEVFKNTGFRKNLGGSSLYLLKFLIHRISQSEP